MAWRAEPIEIAARLEALIDFSDEDLRWLLTTLRGEQGPDYFSCSNSC